MKKMLVLLNRPEDIEGRLSELTEIAITHGIVKIYLARLSRTFGPRARSILAPHKLDMAARMSDAAASRYFSKIADDLRAEGLDVDPIGAGIPAMKIDRFVKKNEISVIMTSDRHSGLCCWLGTGLLGKPVLFLYEHVFGLVEPTLPEHPHPAKTRQRKHRPGKAKRRERDTK